ncbi:MAG: hypothetical protein IH831_07860, partial [Planctomycetes bacterium]|nr:hypothetical protein [Planctomycetota bacterium]
MTAPRTWHWVLLLAFAFTLNAGALEKKPGSPAKSKADPAKPVEEALTVEQVVAKAKPAVV